MLFHVKRAVTPFFTPPCLLLRGTHWYTEHIHNIKYNRDAWRGTTHSEQWSHLWYNW